MSEQDPPSAPEPRAQGSNDPAAPRSTDPAQPDTGRRLGTDHFAEALAADNEPTGTAAHPGNTTRIRNKAGKDLSTDFFRDRHRIRDMVGRFIVGVLVLTITIVISPEIRAESAWSVAAAVIIYTVLSAALRPLMIRVALPFGWFGAAILAIFGSFVVMYLALRLTPGIVGQGPWQIFIATWIYAIILALVQWLMAADGDDVFLVQVIRQSTRGGTWGSRLSKEEQAAVDAGEHPQLGVIFVQLDGMPAPVLDWAVKSGNLPNLSRWIRSGEYSWSEWHARVPSTTPVSQAGLLHGTSADMPAFRWYERDLGRLLVANHPPDAELIEERISNGAGLLADNGVSISNLFSGDAESRLLVMSGMSNVREGLGPSRSYASFFTHPSGFTRAMVLTVGEMIKEKYQARSQVKRNVVPRIKRHGSYVFLRGVTNVLLRDLNTALVIEAMMKGSKSIYVDFVDYDEIAHHAGVQRAESLRALEGLDHVLGQLERIVRYAPRPYRFVCVSDHGQSQGSTFLQRFGVPLEEVVRELMGVAEVDVAAATGTVEAWGPVNVFLSQLQQQDSVTGGLTRKAMRNRTKDGAIELGPGNLEHTEADTKAGQQRPELVVVGSGNLGGIWFAREPKRLNLEDMEVRWPGLVAGLASHPGVSFAVVNSATHGPVAIGAHGVNRLLTGIVEGQDPLAPFGPLAGPDMLRVAQFKNAPDIYVNSMYDVVMDEVAAFEELVGCHGGIGGWQTRAILVHPAAWKIEPERLGQDGALVGAEAVHHQMVQWLEALGHRKDLARPILPDNPNETPEVVTFETITHATSAVIDGGS